MDVCAELTSYEKYILCCPVPNRDLRCLRRANAQVVSKFLVCPSMEHGILVAPVKGAVESRSISSPWKCAQKPPSGEIVSSRKVSLHGRGFTGGCG